MYCLKCDYGLTGVPPGPCPECGVWFDPAQPRTYAEWPRAERWRHVQMSAGSLLVPIVFTGIACGMYWSCWQTIYIPNDTPVLSTLRTVLTLGLGFSTLLFGLLVLWMAFRDLAKAFRHDEPQPVLRGIRCAIGLHGVGGILTLWALYP
jgi:hypothetical protein